MEKTSASVYIKKGQGRALKAGGLWIYDNEIDRTEGEFENGDMVNVFDFDGYPLGCGFINTRSTITIRMMSRKPHTVVDEDFIEMRVRNAWEYRKSTVDTGSCRLVFGEADFLPGIVIDKFSDAGGGIPGPGHRPVEASDPGKAEKGPGRGRNLHPRRL